MAILAFRPIPLGALALLVSGCLDFGYEPAPDAGVDASQDSIVPSDDAETPECPSPGTACADRCGPLELPGCEPYDCGACHDDNCTPVVSCASIQAQCGSLDTGCGVVDCTNRCDEGVSCVENRCCTPEPDAVACRGLCSGSAVNNCGDEVVCENPCGPHSTGCRDAEPPVAATCFCPHAYQGETCEERQLPLVRPSDLVIDPASGRAYVLDMGLDAVLVLDLETGARFALSDGDDDGVARGTGPAFVGPHRIALDLPNRRAFVTDTNLEAILQVGLDDGRRVILSGTGQGEGPALRLPKGIVLDVPNDLAYVVDANNALIAVTLSTGDRRVVSTAAEGAAVGAGPPLHIPLDLAVDLPGKRAYVFGGESLFAVDLASGDRTVLSTASKFANPDGTLRGSGPSLKTTFAGILDLPNRRAFAADVGWAGVLAIDLDTGDRTFVSAKADADGAPHGTGPELELPHGLRFDTGGAGLWLVDAYLGAIMHVDIASGDRSPRVDGGVGPGPHLLDPSAVAFDAKRSRALVVDGSFSQNIVQVDLATGARSVFAERDVAIKAPIDVAVDRAGHYAFVADRTIGLVRFDLETGEHSLISDLNDDSLGVSGLGHIELDEPRQLMLAVGGLRLIAVDLATGRRTVLSDASHGSGPLFEGLVDLAYDQANHAALVVDRNAHALLRVDVLDGTRTLLSGEDPDGVVHGEGQAFADPSAVAFDANAQVAYVADRKTNTVVAVDLATGDRTTVSTLTDGTRRGNGLPFADPKALTLDGSGHLLVIDAGFHALLSVDPATGDRTIVSRIAF